MTIWHPSDDAPTPADARRAVRRLIADYAPRLQQLDDDEIDAAIAQALATLDAADPLIYYYAPGVPTVSIPSTWRVTDCYRAIPEPDEAIPWTQAGNTISTISTDTPLWRIIISRRYMTTVRPKSVNTRQLAPGEYTWQNSTTLTLTPPREAAMSSTWSIGDYVLIRPYPLSNPTAECGLYIAADPPAVLQRQPSPLYTPLIIARPTGTETIWITAEWFSGGYMTNWAPAPASSITTAEHTTITLIAAALIILARTDPKHPANDWAAHTLATVAPILAHTDTTSHGIRTRADYLDP